MNNKLNKINKLIEKVVQPTCGGGQKVLIILLIIIHYNKYL